MSFKIVEKQKPLAVHAHCATLESAQRWISEKAPDYCARGLFMDKTLTPDSFEIKPLSEKAAQRAQQREGQ